MGAKSKTKPTTASARRRTIATLRHRIRDRERRGRRKHIRAEIRDLPDPPGRPRPSARKPAIRSNSTLAAGWGRHGWHDDADGRPIPGPADWHRDTYRTPPEAWRTVRLVDGRLEFVD